MAITDENRFPKDPVTIVPKRAAAKEITKVIMEIQKFTGLLIFIPWML